MIRINLLPAEDAVRAAGRRHDVALGVLVLAMATFGLIVAHTWQRARVVVAEREQRRHEWTQLRGLWLLAAWYTEQRP